jgi:hypothetical protein
VPETKTDISFCAHAITLAEETVIVRDASLDARFSDHPLVTGEPKIRFYADAPPVTEDGFVLGTLCVIDHVPKELSAAQTKALEVLRNQVMRELELRRKNIELSEANKKLEQARIDFSERERLLIDCESSAPLFKANIELKRLPFPSKSIILCVQGSRSVLVKRDPLQVWTAERVRELAPLACKRQSKNTPLHTVSAGDAA